MERWSRAFASGARATAAAALLLGVAVTSTLAAGPPFPPPVEDRTVYDEAGILSASAIAELEERIALTEAESGVEIVVYTQVDPDVSETENLRKAAALIDEWGIGRAGFDDGLVLLVGMQPNRINGKVSLYGGSGFVRAYIDEDGLADLVANVFLPRARDRDFDAAAIETIERVQERVAPGSVPLTVARVANAVLGLVLAPFALIASAMLAYLTWRRRGRDPVLVDSPSILMAGPPAAMTPAMATVIMAGRAQQHSVNTALVELAGSGRIAFRNLDRVGTVKSDDAPDPLNDPAIVVNPEPVDARPLGGPEAAFHAQLVKEAGARGELVRRSLWSLNGSAGATLRRQLEELSVRIGWFTEKPSRAIGRMTGLGAAEAVLGALLVGGGAIVPISGGLLLGGALLLGGSIVIGFGTQMSQRSPEGARMEAMLRAYRRTLEKELSLARSMDDVVANEEVAVLADTPDRAVVWGLALGLHEQVAAVLERTLADAQTGELEPARTYYPHWLASHGGSGAPTTTATAGGVTASRGGGSIFSGSAIPNIGGMFAALGSVGSTPPSSSSSSSGGSGGFSGGSSSGGGGASGSF